MTQPPSPEFRALVDAVRPGPSQPEETAALVRAGLRWAELLRLAAHHRVEPLLHRSLCQQCVRPLVPEPALDSLAATYVDHGRRNLCRFARLRSVAALLDATDIPVVLLKGAALVPLVYRDMALRPMNDIDVLVRSGDAGRAIAVLEDAGFRRRRCVCCPEGGSRRHPPQDALVDDDGVAVDVHDGLPFDWDVDGLWDRARSAHVGGRSYLVPSPEDLLVHVVLHFFRDRGRGSANALAQLADIAHLMAGAAGAVDWPWLANEVREHDLGPAWPLTLLAVERLLRADVPPVALARTGGGAGVPAATVERFVAQRVLRSEATLKPLVLRPSRRSVRLLFPTRDFLEQRYGRPVSRTGAGRMYGWRLLRGSRLGLTTLRGARAHLALDRTLRELGGTSEHRRSAVVRRR